MYDPQHLLNLIDDNAWWILGGFAIAMVFQWIWLIECVRMAKRERAYSMPLFCTFFWFAHDTGVTVRFHDWFVTYDHWFLQLFWVGLITAVVLELVFFAQVVKYGKDELVPGVGTRGFVLGLVAVQIASSVTWEFFKFIMDDPLYQASPAVTMVSYPLMGAALLFRRRSSIGQNVTMWASFTAMTVCWSVVTAIWYGAGFRSWQYLAAGAVAALGGLVMMYLVSERSHFFTRIPLGAAPRGSAAATPAWAAEGVTPRG